MKEMSQEEKNVMIQRLEELKLTEGWKILVEQLKENLEYLTDRLCNEDKSGETIEDVRVKRKHRIVVKRMIEFPDEMIAKLKPVEEQISDSLDPY